MTKKPSSKKGRVDGDFFFCLVLICIAIFLLSISSTTLKVDESSLGPFFWPKTMLFGLLACGGIKLVFHFLKRRELTDQNNSNVTSDYRALVLIVVVTFAYFLGVVLVGYPIASVLFVIALCYLGGIRNLKLALSVSAGLTLVTSFLFVGLMYISLPRGVWFFYDITNWFFSLIKF